MKHVHFIGLCGMGMSATALLVKESGAVVTGSDAECYGPPGEILARAKISPSLPYDPENIPDDVDTFVIGRSAKVSVEENAEVRQAHATGKPIRSFPEVLSELTKDRKNVVVAGSYGKSTTTTLIAHILRHAGVDAGYFIGAEPSRPEKGQATLTAPASLGTSPEFVLEGDEYPSAHDDPTAKFLHLHPRDIVLTSVVHDHVNVYPTYEDYKKPFSELLSMVEDDGIIVACADEPGARDMARASGKFVVLYGVHEGAYRASDITYGARTTFSLIHADEKIAAIETGLLGAHNVEDIVAASAYVLSRTLVTPTQLEAAVKAFAGVRRRLDNITPNASVPVYEGFGSSYEKARAAIEAIRLHFGTRDLVIVFEPHTFGWRNRANLSWYDDVFDGARMVVLCEPPTQGANTHDQLSGQEITARLQEVGTTVCRYNPEDMADTIGLLRPEDVVLVLTSGDLEGSITSFIHTVEETFPR